MAIWADKNGNMIHSSMFGSSYVPPTLETQLKHMGNIISGLPCEKVPIRSNLLAEMERLRRSYEVVMVTYERENPTKFGQTKEAPKFGQPNPFFGQPSQPDPSPSFIPLPKKKEGKPQGTVTSINGVDIGPSYPGKYDDIIKPSTISAFGTNHPQAGEPPATKTEDYEIVVKHLENEVRKCVEACQTFNELVRKHERQLKKKPAGRLLDRQGQMYGKTTNVGCDDVNSPHFKIGDAIEFLQMQVDRLEREVFEERPASRQSSFK